MLILGSQTYFFSPKPQQLIMILFPTVVFDKKEIKWCTDVLYKYFTSKDARYQSAKDDALGSWIKKYLRLIAADVIAIVLVGGLFLGVVAYLEGQGVTTEPGGGIEKFVIGLLIVVALCVLRIIAGTGSFISYRSKVKQYFSEFEALASESKDWTTFAFKWIRNNDPYFFKAYYAMLKANEDLKEQIEVHEEVGLEGKGNYHDGMREGWWRYYDDGHNVTQAGFYEDDAMIFGITYDENRKPNGFWHDK